MGRIASAASLSPAAVAQVLRDYPLIQQFVQFVAWVGLNEEERGALERLTADLARRLAPAQIPGAVRGRRTILRERRSSAKAKRR